MGLKPDEFKNMTWGDYTRCVLGYRIKEHTKSHQYRNILAGLIHQDPRRIFELPGDYDHIPQQRGTKTNIEILSQHGFDKILGIKGVC